MISAYSDGGSRGNPGISAFGIVLVKDGKVVFERAEFLGVRTNNYAEYRGLIAAISKVIELGEDSAEFVMDSQLVIRQMRGEYRVKSPDMKALYEDAVALSSLIPHVSFRNVRRSEEFIPRADAILNAEMDRHSKRRPRILRSILQLGLSTGSTSLRAWTVHLPSRPWASRRCTAASPPSRISTSPSGAGSSWASWDRTEPARAPR